MAAAQAQPDPSQHNIVSWALSGDYDPHRAVLIDSCDPQRYITKHRATTLIACLTGAFEENSTVCLHLANDVLYPILCMAIFASQCRWTGTNIAYTAPELEHHFHTSETKYVITAEDQLETVRAAVDRSGTQAEIIVFSDLLFPQPRESDHAHSYEQPSGDRFRTLHDLFVNRSPESLFNAIREIDIHSIASLMSTSGTTGRPKMAARTHRATVLETDRIVDAHSNKPYPIRRLYCTPMFHSFSAPDMIVNSLRLGFPTYFMKRFHEDDFPQNIRQFKITETFAPPPMILRLINNPDAANLLQSLRRVYTGGAPLVPELKAQFVDMLKLPSLEVVQVWGMTEGGWFTTFKYPETDGTSVGRPLYGYEIKVGPTHCSTLCDGRKVGELYVKSDSVMSYYWGNKKETAQAFDGEWLRTGDVGYIENGMIYLVDRAKDLIKVKGWQVSPSEIEDAFMVSPHVKDVGVVGVGTDVHEHPMAFVVLVDNNLGITKELLKEHLLQRLARYKVASCEIRFIDAIPRSASGKILKNELRQVACT